MLKIRSLHVLCMLFFSCMTVPAWAGAPATYDKNYVEDAILTEIAYCRMTEDGNIFARVFIGAPYPEGRYCGNVPVFVETQTGREKLFQEAEAQQAAQQLDWSEEVPVAVSFYVIPKYFTAACVGVNKEILLLSGIVPYNGLNQVTSALFWYSPYTRRIERIDDINMNTPPYMLYLGEKKTILIHKWPFPGDQEKYSVLIKNQDGSTDGYGSPTLPDPEGYYNIIEIPESLYK